MSKGSEARVARLFAALGDPTRLRLVTTLSDGEPRSISALASQSELTRQAVTKHLHVLEDVGIVRARRAGREMRFEYLPLRIEEARSYLERVSSQWDEALERLRAMVEEDEGRADGTEVARTRRGGSR